MRRKRIGILNSGGDAPGLNAVIASAVKAAHVYKYDCIGIIRGLEGLLTPVSHTKLNLQNTWEIIGRGGTILKSVNKGKFSAKVGSGEINKIDSAVLKEAKENLAKLKIDSLIVIGGDGTLSSAAQLAETGVNIVGVPKTIDNDLLGTDKTFGFNSAVSVIVEAIDRIRTTASSHDRIFFIETMGRNAGWLALYSGVAAEADMILLPEFEFNYDKIISHLRGKKDSGRHYQIVVVAEGAKAAGNRVYKSAKNKQESLLGGISERIMKEIENISDDEFEMRNLILGHMQRGGSPNSEDRILSQRFGEAAVMAVVNGNFGKMVGLRGNKIVLTDIKKAVENIKQVDEDYYLVQTAKNIGISFGF